MITYYVNNYLCTDKKKFKYFLIFEGVLRSTGPAGGGPNPALHASSDSFNVPKKYLGLLIGKGGESIRKFRAYAAEHNMAIVINQQGDDAHGCVVISGDNPADITSLKADLTQNLFTAITNLENEGSAGAWGGISGPSSSTTNFGRNNMSSNGGKGSYGLQSSSGNGIGTSWRSGPYSSSAEGGSSYKGGLNAAGNYVPSNALDMGGPTGNKTEDASWWADVFTQVLTKKNSPPGGPMSGGGLGSSFSLDGSSSNNNFGLGGSWDASATVSNWGTSTTSVDNSNEGDLNNALAALLGNGW